MDVDISSVVAALQKLNRGTPVTHAILLDSYNLNERVSVAIAAGAVSAKWRRRCYQETRKG